MRRIRRSAACALTAIAALALSTAVHGSTAYADPHGPGQPPAGKARGDVRNVGPDYNQGKALGLERKKVRQSPSMLSALAADPTVGTTKTWLALNDFTNGIYLKNYTLRGVGQHIQVWVADDTTFPAGDCRNDLGLSQITDDQVNSFVHEFDTNIYPKESQTFSVPPNRDGSGAALPGLVGLPADYYQVSSDQADDITVLVDNVRDANYYDPSTPDGQTYIAGFFYSVFNEYV